MAAGWRELQKYEDVKLKVVAWDTQADQQVAFDENLVSGLDCTLLAQNQRDDFAKIASLCRDFQPDVLVVPGWMSLAYRRLALDGVSRECQVFMGMDTPWQGAPKQYLTYYRYRKFLRRVDRVVVAGERTWQYARRLGFAESQLHRGVYCYDAGIFLPKSSAGSSKKFLYVGRYAPEKGLDVLLEAYQTYRAKVEDPWPLTCAGKGPLKTLIDAAENVTDLGFIDPRTLPDVYQKHSVFVLPSRHEPWGVVLAEAMGCGLPVIASEACGAGIDLVRQYSNGISVPTGDVKALASAMTWMHSHAERLPEMRSCAAEAAKPFAASKWAVRWRQWIQEAKTKR